jgi:hypothetical protein
MINKICNICNTEKKLDDFTNTKYKGEIRKRSTCKNCTTLRVKKWVNDNKEKRIEYIKKYSEENKEYIAQKSREYYYNNTQKVIDYNVNYKKERAKVDDLFKLRQTLHSTISGNFRQKNVKKPKKTELILGCSFQYFKFYIESKFEPWMNWDNKGKYNGEINYGWDLDHIIPVCSAETEEELIRLNHYTNFQPLCSYINRYMKRGRI